jgi:hypothetical protein
MDTEKIVERLCRTTDQGFISSRYITVQLLSAVDHPFHSESSYKIRARDPKSHLRRQLVSALKYRSTKFLIIDESHHLL